MSQHDLIVDDDETNQQQSQQVVEDYEWDETKVTETAWTWSKREKKQRGRRAYGRRNNNSTSSNSNNNGGIVQDSSSRSNRSNAYGNLGSKGGSIFGASSTTSSSIGFGNHSSALEGDEQWNGMGIDPFHNKGRSSSLPALSSPTSHAGGFPSSTPAPGSAFPRYNDDDKDDANIRFHHGTGGGGGKMPKRSLSLPTANKPPTKPFGTEGQDGIENHHPNLTQITSSSTKATAALVENEKLNPASSSPQKPITIPPNSDHFTSQSSQQQQPMPTLPLSSSAFIERSQSPTFSVISGSSFSSLSRAGETGSSSNWVKKTLLDGLQQHSSSDLSTNNNNNTNGATTAAATTDKQQPPLQSLSSSSIDIHDTTTSSTAICLTPSRNSTTSNRKRGVCDTPLMDGDCDLSDVENNSDNANPGGGGKSSTTGSFTSRRARSRIFSPDSTKKRMELESNNNCNNNSDFNFDGNGSMTALDRMMNMRSEVDNDEDSDSDHEEENSILMMNTSMCTDAIDESYEEYDAPTTKKEGMTILNSNNAIDTDAKMTLKLPARPRRMSSVGGGSFADTVFAPVEIPPMNNTTTTTTINTNTNTNTNTNGNNKDNVNNDNNTSEIEQDPKETIPVFQTMSSYKDLKFILKELRRWNTNTNASKKIVAFGMSKCIIVPPNKWPSIRKASMITWATSHLGFCLRSGGRMVNYLQISAEKAVKLHKELESALIEYKKRTTSKTTTAVAKADVYDDPYLLHPLKDDHPFKSEEVEAPFSSIKIMPNANTSITPLFHGNMSGVRSGPSKPLTPMVIERALLLSPNADGHIEKDLFNKLSHLSLDTPKGAASQDGSHTTPLLRMVTLAEEDTAGLKPPRLSYDNNQGMNTYDFVSHMHGVSPNIPSQQICRPSGLKLPLRKFSDGVVGSAISPALQQIPSAALSFDGAETPMPKFGSRIWGTRPIAGRDWGQSKRCDESILCSLRNQLEEAIAALDPEPNEFQIQELGTTESRSSPIVPTPPPDYVKPAISSIAIDSDNLGFDYEVEPCKHKLETVRSSNGDNESVDDVDELSRRPIRQESLGASGFAALNLNGMNPSPMKERKRRESSFAKHNRMSICASAMESRRPFRPSQQYSNTFISNETSDICKAKDNIRDLSSLFIEEVPSDSEHMALNDTVLAGIFSFLTETELLCCASVVCTKWADAATDAHASLMLISVGCSTDFVYGSDNGIEEDAAEDDISLDDEIDSLALKETTTIAESMQRPWKYLTDTFPWANFLSEGAFKRVYKVWNTTINAEEAVSVMNVDLITDKNIVGAELAVSVMLSSLVRRNICPNFVLTRGVFTSSFEPSESCWGCAEKKKPLGAEYNPCANYRKPRQPNAGKEGKFQYIRMELCAHGDVEEYLARQPGKVICPDESRMLLFQMAFSLHVAGDRFAMKHYDVKLLNFFLQSPDNKQADTNQNSSTVIRYGIGSHFFNLKMKTSRALIAKLADYGTANVRPESDGQPVLLSNFTTLENSPPEFMILGDAAQQGYGHDCFGLGLCMLHLFTGHAPYEEILETVSCPPHLKKKLKRIWEYRNSSGYEVIRSVILGDVHEDEDGNIEGEPDEVFYDTFYRFLVLFGIPSETTTMKNNRVWKAVLACLKSQCEETKSTRPSRRNHAPTDKQVGLDFAQYERDCEAFSFLHGSDGRISRARENLQRMDGGVDLLFRLISFDPNKRATALDVINSSFMVPLREEHGTPLIEEGDIVHAFTSYSSKL